MTFSLDSFQPGLLRCDLCGHALTVALDPCDEPAALRGLTEDEAAAYWLDPAAEIRLHGLVCAGVWSAPMGTL